MHRVDLGESFPTRTNREEYTIFIEKDEGADRPGPHAAGADSAASRKKEAKTAAPGRRQKAPSGDKGTQKTKKASVAPKEK